MQNEKEGLVKDSKVKKDVIRKGNMNKRTKKQNSDGTKT